MNRKSICLGIAGIIVGSVFLVSSFSIRQASILSSSPVAVPRFVSALMILMSALLVFRELVRGGVKTGNEKEAAAALQIDNKGAVLSIIGGNFLYAVLLDILGFIVCTFLYLSSVMLLLDPDRRAIWKKLVISAALTAVIYLMFGVVFGATLPAGILMGR